MRTLNEYFISMGTLDLGGTTDTTTAVCIPDGGNLVGIAYATSEAIDIAGSADVLVNGSASGTDIDFPATVVDVGAVALPDVRLSLSQFDSIQLLSKDEPATGIFDCIAIIRR